MDRKILILVVLAVTLTSLGAWFGLGSPAEETQEVPENKPLKIYMKDQDAPHLKMLELDIIKIQLSRHGGSYVTIWEGNEHMRFEVGAEKKIFAEENVPAGSYDGSRVFFENPVKYADLNEDGKFEERAEVKKEITENEAKSRAKARYEEYENKYEEKFSTFENWFENWYLGNEIIRENGTYYEIVIRDEIKEGKGGIKKVEWDYEKVLNKENKRVTTSIWNYDGSGGQITYDFTFKGLSIIATPSDD